MRDASQFSSYNLQSGPGRIHANFAPPCLYVCGRVLSMPARGKFPPWNSNTPCPSSALSNACGA